MMLVKKLIASAMVSGLLWAAGFAGRAVVASYPGLLLLAGQLRLSLGDREGGLRLMEQAAQQDETSGATAAPATVPASAVVPASAKRPASPEVRRVMDAAAPGTRHLTAVAQPLPPDFVRQIERRQRDLVRLSLEQARMDQQVRVLVAQRMRDLPQPPAVPAEPMRATP